MATAPVAYQSALIESLRAASPGFDSDNLGVKLLANDKNSKPLKFNLSTQTSGLANNPALLTLTSAPPVTGGGGNGSRPGGGNSGGGAGGGGAIVIGPSVGPSQQEVPDYTDDMWPPVDEPVAESFPVPDPSPADAVDLPPLDEAAESFPVPDPSPWDPQDLPPLEQDQEVPDYTDDLWPPVYDEIPEGEIEVGPPGSGQPARDAIGEIGDITKLGDPLDELGDIEVPVPDILFNDGRIDVPDYTNDLWGPDQSLDEQNLLEMALFDMLSQELLSGGGGGGGIGGMNLYMQE